MTGKGRTLPLDLGPTTGRNRRVLLAAPRPREGLLTEPIAGAQPRVQERALMPPSGRSLHSMLGAVLPLGAISISSIDPVVTAVDLVPCRSRSTMD